jgi:hypothetical protein
MTHKRRSSTTNGRKVWDYYIDVQMTGIRNFWEFMTHLDSQIKPFSQSQEIHDQTNIPPNELFPPAGIVCRRYSLERLHGVGALRPKPEGGVVEYNHELR